MASKIKLSQNVLFNLFVKIGCSTRSLWKGRKPRSERDHWWLYKDEDKREVNYFNASLDFVA